MSFAHSQLARQATTSKFNEYRRLVRVLLIEEFDISPRKARTLCDLLDALESLRVSFTKGQYCFETKRVSSLELGERIGVSERYVRALMSILERCGIVSVVRKRFRRNRNCKNRYCLSGFIGWLSTISQDSASPVPRSKDNNQRLLFQRRSQIKFPKQDFYHWDRSCQFWRKVAEEVLKSWEVLPCLKLTAMDFRINLQKYNIPLDHPSIIPRWKAFVRRRVDFASMRKRAT